MRIDLGRFLRSRFGGIDARKRRRIDIALLACGVAVTGLAALVGAMGGDDERVANLWAGAEVGADGSSRIVEVVDFDFGSTRRHGIFRDVPGLLSDGRVVVDSRTAPDEVVLTRTGDQTRIRIGDPNRTVSGRHRYNIEYALESLAPGGELAWDAVGTSWEVPIRSVEVHVVAPFRMERPGCVKGELGSSRSCNVRQLEPGHLVAEVDGLKRGEGVTVSATAADRIEPPILPPRPSGRAHDPGTGVIGPIAIAVLAALAGAFAASVRIRRAGRERVAVGGAADAAWAGADGPEAFVLRDAGDLAELATVEFAPPGELSPAQGGVLLAEGVRDEHKAAWLVQAAIEGYVDLEEEGSDVTLVRRDRGDGTTAATIDQAFAGRPQLKLGSYDPSFASAWEAVGKELSTWQRASGLWDPAGDRKTTAVRVVGVILFALGLLAVGLAAGRANVVGSSWLPIVVPGAMIAGAGWAGFVRGWELRVRTARGSGLWLRVESFRRFLAQSEAYHAEEAAKRGVLREYTAWAVAVGEVDRWSRAVRSAPSAAADPSAMHYAMVAPSLTSAASSTSVDPSSSGGGGGGSVGGGGGGGGGGSW